jgi:Phage integrase, N-terminal SAM-like domain
LGEALTGVIFVRGRAQVGWVLIIGTSLLRIDHSSVLSRIPDAPVEHKPKLLDQVREAIRMWHDSLRTEEAYVSWIKRFTLFHGKHHPLEMGEDGITRFLSALAVHGHVTASA